jgi:hypothetical protein
MFPEANTLGNPVDMYALLRARILTGLLELTSKLDLPRVNEPPSSPLGRRTDGLHGWVQKQVRVLLLRCLLTLALMYTAQFPATLLLS